ncbi:MAG TPA: Uma2 family endonuclease [Actinomycetota bacterium]|nr:Uma2 family endonuclease [Actinomycetota bacterium]
MPEGTQRYELVEGALLVNPPPSAGHQGMSLRLAIALHTVAPPGVTVLEAVGVRLPGGTLLVPDVLVVSLPAPEAERALVLDATQVSLVVEIVSPGSQTTDRLTKPALYARAGVPLYWRVEPDEGPSVTVYQLDGHEYIQSAMARPGRLLAVTKPFPISLDPAALRP